MVHKFDRVFGCYIPRQKAMDSDFELTKLASKRAT